MNLSFIGVIYLNCKFFVGYIAEIIEDYEVGLRKHKNFLHICFHLCYLYLVKRRWPNTLIYVIAVCCVHVHVPAYGL